MQLRPDPPVGNIWLVLLAATQSIMEQLGCTDIPLGRSAARGLVGTPTFNPEVHRADGCDDADQARRQWPRWSPKAPPS